MKKTCKLASVSLVMALLAGCMQAAPEMSSDGISPAPAESTVNISSSPLDNSLPASSGDPSVTSESTESSSNDSMHLPASSQRNETKNEDEAINPKELVNSLSFLSEEQQSLYQEAVNIAPGLFGMPGNLMYYWGYKESDMKPSDVPDTYELYDVSYEEFSNRVLTIFTTEFLNRIDYAEKFTNYNGQLLVDGWRSNDMPYGTTIQVLEAYPDAYRLERQDENGVEFILISHYDRNGWNDGEMDVYTIEYPIRMVRTKNGWRIDEFHVTQYG